MDDPSLVELVTEQHRCLLPVRQRDSAVLAVVEREGRIEVRELHQWFERLWSEGDSVDMDELNAVARAELVSTPHSQSEIPRLSSSARGVNARITTPLEIDDEIQPGEKDNDLVERVSRAPDLEMDEEYQRQILRSAF